jgi:hypothetical protein
MRRHEDDLSDHLREKLTPRLVGPLVPEVRDGQPLSFSASSVWGVSTRFRTAPRTRAVAPHTAASDAPGVGLSQLAQTQTLLLAAAIETEGAALLVLRSRLVNEL